ncbi:MAG: hypothetical protein KTR19_00485 [Hyphomicrobiales bacterium]|nr:hypothetical protein [Hyphomicrobiales bacterium]
MWRWFKLETNSESWRKRYQPQRASHARLWLVFGIIIPVTFLAAMSFRQTPPADFEPQRLSEAGETAQ